MHRCRGKTFNPFTELAFRILSRLKDLGAAYFVNFIKHFCQFDSVTRMLSAPQVVDTSVTFNNSPVQGYTHLFRLYPTQLLHGCWIQTRKMRKSYAVVVERMAKNCTIKCVHVHNSFFSFFLLYIYFFTLTLSSSMGKQIYF